MGKTYNFTLNESTASALSKYCELNNTSPEAVLRDIINTELDDLLAPYQAKDTAPQRAICIREDPALFRHCVYFGDEVKDGVKYGRIIYEHSRQMVLVSKDRIFIERI